MLLSEEGMGKRMATGVKCKADASACISGARSCFQLSSFCLYTSENGSSFPVSSMYTESRRISTSRFIPPVRPLLISFYSTTVFQQTSVEPPLPAYCDWNILFNLSSRTCNPFFKQHFSLVHIGCKITWKWVQTLLETHLHCGFQRFFNSVAIMDSVPYLRLSNSFSQENLFVGS